MWCANASRDTLVPDANIALKIITVIRKYPAATASCATATITLIYVELVTAIRTPVIASNVYSIPMVPTARSANPDSTETPFNRIVKIVGATSWALIRLRDRVAIAPDNVLVYRTS